MFDIVSARPEAVKKTTSPGSTDSCHWSAGRTKRTPEGHDYFLKRILRTDVFALALWAGTDSSSRSVLLHESSIEGKTIRFSLHQLLVPFSLPGTPRNILVRRRLPQASSWYRHTDPAARPPPRLEHG